MHDETKPRRNRYDRIAMLDDKERELRNSKRRALALLLAAAGVFAATLFAPRGFWIDGVKAVAEASMVGALADWFAVVALFRRVPIPFVSRHTEIIPQNKDKIADNLAAFVHEKFLDPASIVALIKRHDPAARLAQWLATPRNANVLGGYAARLVAFGLDMTDDARIQSFVKDAFHAVLERIDLSQSAGAILDTLTKDGRHQALLDDGIAQIVGFLRDPDNRASIAAYIVDWLKYQFPKMEKLLPDELARRARRGADLERRHAGAHADRRRPGASAAAQLRRRGGAPRHAAEERSGVHREGRGDQALPARRRRVQPLREGHVGPAARMAEGRSRARRFGCPPARDGARRLARRASRAEPGAARFDERARRARGERDGARVRRIPDTAHQRHREELGRARDVAADRAEHRQGPAVHPDQRHAGRRLDRARAVCGVERRAVGGRAALLSRARRRRARPRAPPPQAPPPHRRARASSLLNGFDMRELDAARALML
ncbi:conserved hypothetical protein [Burkholderia mallei GB8 horse 4]|nr:conserved hypothetical protein [Burkholderia mallei GB8 horse 4]